MKVQIFLFQLMITNNNKQLLKLLLGFRAGVFSLLLNIFNLAILRLELLTDYNILIEINDIYLFPFLYFCKKHSLNLFTILTDITCYELLGVTFRYTLIYSLLSPKNSLRLFIKIKTKEFNNKIFSITSIYNNAKWSEREIFDFFGIYFYFNKDLRRILLDYGFKGYPLRKDFPLSGFLELFYDETIKKITYEKIILSQEYRIFFNQKKI